MRLVIVVPGKYLNEDLRAVDCERGDALDTRVGYGKLLLNDGLAATSEQWAVIAEGEIVEDLSGISISDMGVELGLPVNIVTNLELRGFKTVAGLRAMLARYGEKELLAVRGVGPSTVEKIKGYLLGLESTGE